ncbi:MAG TPA: hypothetical protein P5247_02575 [Candidatus Saccharimonadales bacterium]|nr:hypothetical protein [Candidatus Saccharimonadales bacterium]
MVHPSLSNSSWGADKSSTLWPIVSAWNRICTQGSNMGVTNDKVLYETGT